MPIALAIDELFLSVGSHRAPCRFLGCKIIVWHDKELDGLDLPQEAKLDPLSGQQLRLKSRDKDWAIYTVDKLWLSDRDADSLPIRSHLSTDRPVSPTNPSCDAAPWDP